MLYEFDLTIPAGTPASVPAEKIAVMASGIIKQVEVQIPRGCRSLVHTVAVRGIHQLWPSNPDGTHKGNDARIIWQEVHDLTDPPHIIILRGWSPGTNYQHVVTWRFNVIAAPVKAPVKVVKKQGILSALINRGAG